MKSLNQKWLPQGSFLRSIGILTGGTVLAQGIMVLAMPFLTRLYTPEDFGLLAVYASLLSIFSVVACLRYNIAIPIPQKDADGFALLIISFVVAAIVGLLLALPIVFAPSASASLIGQPEMGPLLWMLPIGVFLAGSYDALQHWAFRKKRFWSVAFTRITRASVGTGAQVGIGSVAHSPFGLVFGHMLFSGLGLFGLGMDLIHKDREFFRSFSLKASIARAKEHYRFPAFSVPEALMNTMSAELPIILIAAIALGEEAGYLMLAMRVIGLPMALIGSSVSQAYLSEARQKLADGTLETFTRSTMWTLARISALPFVLVGLASPILFPVLFGKPWTEAGCLVAWMVPWFFFQFIASPVSMVLHVLQKQHYAAVLQALGLFIRLGAVWGAGVLFPAFIGEAFAVSGAVFYGIYIWVILTFLQGRK